jgi:hypothetical protein
MGAMVPAEGGLGWPMAACAGRGKGVLCRKRWGVGELPHGQWMMKNPVTKIQPERLADVVEME